MKPARKSPSFEYFFDLYNHFLLRRHFQYIHVNKATKIKGPVIIYSNHVSWWDGLVLFHLNRHIWSRNGYVLMGEKGLQEYPFFRRIGAFAMNSFDSQDVRKGLRYALKLLENPDTLLAWFPQGEERHPDARPLQFADGLVVLLQMAIRHHLEVTIVPMAIRYEFLERKRPEVFISLGEPKTLSTLTHHYPPLSILQLNTLLEDILVSLLDQMSQQIKHWSRADRLNPPDFISLLRNKEVPTR